MGSYTRFPVEWEGALDRPAEAKKSSGYDHPKDQLITEDINGLDKC